MSEKGTMYITGMGGTEHLIGEVADFNLSVIDECTEAFDRLTVATYSASAAIEDFRPYLPPKKRKSSRINRRMKGRPF